MTRNEGLVFAAIGVGLYLLVGQTMSGTFSAITQKIAQAIANAEGFGVPGARPTNDNNPGDLTYDFGFPTIGMDGPFPIFATVTDGWNALYTQVQAIFDGGSHWTPSMSIAQINSGTNAYAGGDSNWTNNVASYLGVSPNTPLSQVT